MNDTQLLLIDLSGLAHQIWHVSGNQPDPSFVSNELVARVRALAAQHPHAAICCDSGRSFRADIDPQYKAQRDTDNRAPLRHAMDVACETLAKDGFPVWRVRGFEADDLIATATTQALAIEGTSVLIASSDKDLLQLVSERVSAKSLIDGLVRGPADVFDKFGVRPEQMGDLLALMGDKSDNIKGAEKIGQVIGARLLSEHGTLAALYGAMAKGVVPGVTPAMRTNLLEFKARWPTVRSLIALRTDVPEVYDATGHFVFAEIGTEREAAPMVEDEDMDDMGAAYDEPNRTPGTPRSDRELRPSESTAALAKVSERIASQQPSGEQRILDALEVGAKAGRAAERLASDRQGMAPYAGPVDFSQQLEPRTMPEAVQLAQRMFESRLFSAYGTPQAVLATVLAGRELGIPAMAALRAFHIIEGKPTMSAGTIQSLVLKSKHARYFRCTERTPERATFVTKRGDDPEMVLTYTIEEGKAAWQKTADAWAKSTWGRSPADMLVARASSKLARLVYPDVVAGLYAPEEME